MFVIRTSIWVIFISIDVISTQTRPISRKSFLLRVCTRNYHGVLETKANNVVYIRNYFMLDISLKRYQRICIFVILVSKINV